VGRKAQGEKEKTKQVAGTYSIIIQFHVNLKF
jgi:hypothetical protein